MSSCFKSPYLGIRGGCRLPLSGLYINDLTGIEFATIAGVSKDEILRAEDMLTILEKQAYIDVKQSVESLIYKDNLFQSVINHDCLTISPDKYVSIEDKNFGLRFERCSNDKFIGACINSITLYSKESYKTTIRIINGSEESEREVFIKEGRNRIDLNLTIHDDEVLIYLYTCGYQVGIYNSDNCECRCKENPNSCYKVYPIESNGVWFSDISQFRMGYDLTCTCDLDYLHCILLKDYANAIRLRTGILIMREILAGTNANPIIYNKQESAKSILSRWEGTPDPQTGFDNKSEYAIAINNIYQRAKTFIGSINSQCIICNSIKTISLV